MLFPDEAEETIKKLEAEFLSEEDPDRKKRLEKLLSNANFSRQRIENDSDMRQLKVLLPEILKKIEKELNIKGKTE